ncbi:reverse transcriptase domain-containing protein [Tanacetum coccineum]
MKVLASPIWTLGLEWSPRVLTIYGRKGIEFLRCATLDLEVIELFPPLVLFRTNGAHTTDASRMEEIEELSANICLMARIQPVDNTSDAGPSYDSAFVSEVQSSSIKDNQEQIGSVEKDTHVTDLYALEQLARNAYKEAEKQQLFAQKVQQQNTTLTSQLELYKERVRVLENIKGDNNYLNEFLEADRQAKHFNQQAKSQFRKNEELQKTHLILKRQLSENKDRYHDTILDLEAKLKKNVDLILKLGNSLQGMFMLGPKPLSVYDSQLKHGLGYPNPYILKQAISQCPKLYLASSLSNLEIPLNVRDIEDTLDDASKSQQKMKEKMNDPIVVANKQNCWTIDYQQINALYKDFVPQKELSTEQKYFPSSFIPSDKTLNATSFIPASMPMLPSNTVPNPQEDLKVITTRSGVTLAGPSVPTPPLSSSKEVERELETTTDQLPPAPISSHMIPELNPHQPSIPYPSSFAKALAHMPKFAKMVKDLLTNKEKLLELENTTSNENYSAVLLKTLLEKLGYTRRFLILCDFYGLESCMALANLGASINLMHLSMWKTLCLPELSPTRMTLELATQTVAYPASIAEDVFVQVGKFTFPANFVVVDYDVDPRDPLILGRHFLRTVHALVDVYGEELTLRVGDEKLVFNSDHVVAYLSPSLIPFGDSDFILEEIDTFIAFDDSIPPDIDDGAFDMEGYIRLIKTLLNNGISNDLPHPLLVFEINETEKNKTSIDDPPDLELKDLPPHLEYAFLEGTSKLPVIIAKDLKREEKEQLLKVFKSHKRAIAWKISDIRGIDPNFCTHKILMEDDFKKGCSAPETGNEFYCFLDGFSEYFQIPIDPQEHEKTTFTCPYGTFAYRRMPFGLCNAPGHSKDMMLKQCEDTNLVLNWEKCHFMVKEDIVLGHKISKSGIEVDRAKVDVIAKLPPSTTVKGIRSFLGHAGFYRRFIQDFSKIAWPMTHLLEKDTPFFFFSECQSSFEILKKKLTKAPILVSPDWDLPFELMCDASDFAVGAVLGQRKDKYFRPIHYASKTLLDAQTHYTVTEKELLAVVYAF